MSDLEQRLGEVLGSAAEEAPTASGLAAAARRRHRVRRQRRLALGAAAVVVAVAASAVTLFTGDGGSGDQVAQEPTEGGGWQQVAAGGVRAAIPTGWERLDCPGARWAPARTQCQDEVGLWIAGSATIDVFGYAGALVEDQGRWTGQVNAGDHLVSVTTPDRELTRRILASVHEPGQPEVDAARWTTFERDGLRYQAPDGWGLAKGSDDGYAVCSHPATAGDTDRSERLDSGHFALWDRRKDVVVTVAAPTQPVAELVMAGVVVVGDPGKADCVGD